jgi:hypothetical protein
MLGPMLFVHVSGNESAFFIPRWSETINLDPKTIALRRLLLGALPQNLTLHDGTSPLTPLCLRSLSASQSLTRKFFMETHKVTEKHA